MSSTSPPSLCRDRLVVALAALGGLRARLGAGEAGARLGASRVAEVAFEAASQLGLPDLARAATAVRGEVTRAQLDGLVSEIRYTLARATGRSGVLLFDLDPERRRLIASAAFTLADPLLDAEDPEEARGLLTVNADAIGLLLVGASPDALELVREARTDPLLRHVTSVVVTRGDASGWPEAILLGAVEVVDAAWGIGPLQDAVGAYLGFEQRSALEFLGDPLTAALTEVDLLARLRVAADDYALFRGGPWSLLVVRVTNLGRIALGLGRGGRNDAMVLVTDAIRAACPEGVEIGLLDGEDLAVFVPDSPRERCAPLVQAIRAAVKVAGPVGRGDQRFVPVLQAVAVAAGAASAERALQAARDLLFRAREDAFPEPIQVAPERSSLALLAEDDPVTSRMVSRLLERQGFQVVARETGPAALETALDARSGFSLVLLDLGLPQISGFELLDYLRRDPRYLDVPVLMITASGDDRHVVHALEHGATDYLVKPMRPDVLLARIRAALRSRRRKPTDDGETLAAEPWGDG